MCVSVMSFSAQCIHTFRCRCMCIYMYVYDIPRTTVPGLYSHCFLFHSKDQYFFIHEAVAEAVVCGVTEVKVDLFPQYLEQLEQFEGEDGDTTRIELEFRVGLMFFSLSICLSVCLSVFLCDYVPYLHTLNHNVF